jgi:hypothetical protein
MTPSMIWQLEVLGELIQEARLQCEWYDMVSVPTIILEREIALSQTA